MEVDNDGVRRSIRISTRKGQNSKDENAWCLEIHAPPTKSRKQETGSKTRSKVEASRAPKVMVSRLQTLERRPAYQLVEMPALVLKRMMHFLDVTSLENLAATCDFFHQFVMMRGVTTLDLPFSNKFIAELSSAKTFHKKEVFRLRSLKEDDTCVPDDEAVFVEYMISSQVKQLYRVFLKLIWRGGGS